MNYWENIQILPMGNVRHFRRILKNDAPFLKTCVFFAEFPEINIFYENHLISANNANLCEFCEKRRTFSERGCRFCEFSENGARFPWVEFAYFQNSSIKINKRNA